jgi:hypothetical protein
MMSLRLLPNAARAGLGVALVVAAWGLSTAASQAQARDNVYWSVGVNSPGVAVGVSNAPPVVYGYPVYDPRPVVVYPRPVVVAPQPVYYGPPAYRWEERRHRKWHKRHHRHHGWDD